MPDSSSVKLIIKYKSNNKFCISACRAAQTWIVKWSSHLPGTAWTCLDCTCQTSNCLHHHPFRGGRLMPMCPPSNGFYFLLTFLLYCYFYLHFLWITHQIYACSPTPPRRPNVADYRLKTVDMYLTDKERAKRAKYIEMYEKSKVNKVGRKRNHYLFLRCLLHSTWVPFRCTHFHFPTTRARVKLK